MAIPTFIERLYYRDIGRFPVISEERERELIKLLQDGAEKKEAINNLILGNLRFVVSVARKYQNRGLALLELVNEGNYGLYKAARRFNLDKQVKFTSYAVWWVRQSIQKALFDQAGVVKIPPNKIAMVNRFRRMLHANDGDFYKTLALKEFKESEYDIVEVLEKMSPVSFDAPLQGEDSGEGVNTMLDIIGTPPEQEESFEKGEMKTILDDILSGMSQREETILRMYYGIDYDKEFTLEEIGAKLELTRERVRQIKNKALRKLFRNKDLRSQLRISGEVERPLDDYDDGDNSKAP